MDKALKIGKTSATGSFHLFIGKTISTIIMAAGTIMLGRLMLQEEYGLYSIALMPSLMIGLFQDWGVNAAMTKYSAQFRSEDREHEIPNLIVSGLAFQAVTSLTLTLVTLILANTLASTVFHRPELAPLIALTSLITLSGPLLTASQSIINGFERMELNTLIMIAQSILKTLAAPLLVLLGYGVLGATLGHALSTLATGAIGIAILYVTIFKELRRTNPNRTSIKQTLKVLLKYGIPLSISVILLGFQIQFYNFMIAYYCTDTMIGNYKIAANFATILTFFTFPISTVLFPTFAKLNPQIETQLLKNVFTSSIRYAALFLVPATMATMVLSRPMTNTLFGDKWVHAPFFLTLTVTTNLFVIFGALVMGGLLTGLGETRMQMKLSILTVCFGLPLAFLLIPPMGVTGAILGTILASLPSLFLGLHMVWKKYKVKADFESSVRILIASTITAVTTYFSIEFFNTADWIQLVLGGTIFLAVYLLVTPLIGAITQSDIKNLRIMLSNLGTISKIINIPLTLTEMAANVYSRNRE